MTFYSIVGSISHLGKMARTSAKPENPNELRSWEINVRGLLKSLCFSVALWQEMLSLIHVAETNVEKCDGLSRYLQLYNGRRTVKNSFTKYNIHFICDWGGWLKDKFVIWQCSLVLPRCSCIFIRSKEYTSLIRYNTPGIYSVVRHPRKRKLSSAKHAQFSCITSHFYSNACQLRPSILSKVRISSITNFFVRVRLCSITEFSHTLRRFD